MENETQNEEIKMIQKTESLSAKKWGIVDSITSAVTTGIISLAVVWAYTTYVPNKNDVMYVVDYVEIINLKKAELIEAYQSGDDERASKAASELEIIIKKSAEIVKDVSSEIKRPVVNKQMLVTFEGTVDITPKVKEQLIKAGLIKAQVTTK